MMIMIKNILISSILSCVLLTANTATFAYEDPLHVYQVGIAKNDPQQLDHAFKILSAQANAGDAASQGQLARIYMNEDSRYFNS